MEHFKCLTQKYFFISTKEICNYILTELELEATEDTPKS